MYNNTYAAGCPGTSTCTATRSSKARCGAACPERTHGLCLFNDSVLVLSRKEIQGEAKFFVFLGGFAAGQPSSAARPPKKHGPASRRPRRPSVESAPLSQPLYCRSTRPTSPPYPAPQLISPPSPPSSPDPLACDLQLASAAVSAARRDSAASHPGRAHFSLPRRTCVNDSPPPRGQGH
jgi:hypothetical protein